MFLCSIGCGLISKFHSPEMPRATENSAHITDNSVYSENTSVSQESSSSDHEMEVQSPSFQPSTSQAQFVPPMFIPYIEGPKMDWTASDGLYDRFLKWKLKCKNILDFQLAMLPESKKCKKVIAWRFWYGSRSFLVLAHRRSMLGYYVGQV